MSLTKQLGDRTSVKKNLKKENGILETMMIATPVYGDLTIHKEINRVINNLTKPSIREKVILRAYEALALTYKYGTYGIMYHIIKDIINKI